ncbi:MAG: sugar kinase [Oscillospiraceae bacterium]|nr:sugar kinase [Oscillospiraceae bacterium]
MRVVTFGEIMLRLSPPANTRFSQAQSYDAHYGGSESNVAAALAQFGVDARFVTRLPDNDISDGAVAGLRALGVDTSEIARGGERVGVYYLERGAGQRPSRVIYDRKNSAIATASRDNFDWKRIIGGADWFHFSGITPALGENVAEIALDAVTCAKRCGATVSCDLNYRTALWSIGDARRVMARFAPHIDIMIANETQLRDVFGDDAHFPIAATTVRGGSSADENDFAGELRIGGTVYRSRGYRLSIVDRIGGGDAFAAGLIYAQLNGYAPQDAVEFAAAAGALKHTIDGDVLLANVSEVEAVVDGGDGRVDR